MGGLPRRVAAASDVRSGDGFERDRRAVRGRQLRRAVVAVAATALVTLALAGCVGTSTDDTSTFVLPPAGATPDYQLGGAYDPAEGVGIVGRDRSDEPAEGLYSICYVNGFQTQPGELDSWPADLLLQRDESRCSILTGPTKRCSTRRPMIAATASPRWSRPGSRVRRRRIRRGRVRQPRFVHALGRALTLDDNLALATLLVDVAHGSGLAAGQKNAAEDAAMLHERAGFDFAVVEECGAYEECAAFTDVYGDAVVDIEYSDELPRPFAEMCADDASPASMVLRDRDLVTPGHEQYVFETCP